MLVIAVVVAIRCRGGKTPMRGASIARAAEGVPNDGLTFPPPRSLRVGRGGGNGGVKDCAHPGPGVGPCWGQPFAEGVAPDGSSLRCEFIVAPDVGLRTSRSDRHSPLTHSTG